MELRDVKHGKAYLVSKRYLLKKARWITSCPVSKLKQCGSDHVVK